MQYRVCSPTVLRHLFAQFDCNVSRVKTISGDEPHSETTFDVFMDTRDTPGKWALYSALSALGLDGRNYWIRENRVTLGVAFARSDAVSVGENSDDLDWLCF